jgi:hypothetical protein
MGGVHRWLLTTFLLATAACASVESDDDAAEESGSAVASFDPGKFSFRPGFERIAQHQARTNDIIELQKLSTDAKHLYWLGRLSAIVYEQPEKIVTELAAIGLPSDPDHVRFFENTETDTQVLYVTTASLGAPPAEVPNPYNATSPHFAALVFRGTEVNRIEDIRRDLFTWKRDDGSSIGAVHSGFRGALESVWKDNASGLSVTFAPPSESTKGLSSFLSKHHWLDATRMPKRTGAELYFTGHSMGGAIATLALSRTIMDTCLATGGSFEDPCFRQYVPVSGLVTFGSPRVGNGEFANRLSRWMQDRTPMFRVVHGKDGVTKVPNINFAHVGFDDGDEEEFRVHIVDGPPRITIGEKRVDEGNGTTFGDHKMTAAYMPVLTKLAAH